MGGVVSRWISSKTESPSDEEGKHEEPVLANPLGFAWVTLATNDSYSLGALVLAHSLRNVNTAHKLAVLITPGVSPPMKEQLSTVFDVVKVVDVLDSKDEAHLALMKRPELGVTFTKIHCWRLTEFEKCVFLDADTLVLKNCDELFEREELSAAPDVGWPDCFNTGVFVFKPSIETFDNLIKFSLENRSFDGGDQGLLNSFFGDWATKDINKHLPFVYNLTSVAVYSYVPAFKQYETQVRIVHFIGSEKPWMQQLDPQTGSVNTRQGSEHITPMLQMWWDIFCDKVHPSMTSNLECDIGMRNDEIEACVNDSPTKPEPENIQPITPYVDKDDSRQINLPYQPFEVRSSSGELLNITYLEKRDQEMREEEKVEEEVKKEVEKPEEWKGEENNQQPEVTYEEKDVSPDLQKDIPSGEGQPEEHPVLEKPESPRKDPPQEEAPPVEPSPFNYETFFPDETCVQAYLEQNVMTYQPLDNREKKQEVMHVPEQEHHLPRFLTIAEDDKRQSQNTCYYEEPKPSHPPPEESNHYPSENQNQTITEAPSSQVPETSPEPVSPKWKSMSNLGNAPPAIPLETVSFWKSHPSLNETNRRYSMPKLKPILPKHSITPVFISDVRPKITQYTEFHMSCEYPDAVSYDTMGFVERHILEEVAQKVPNAEADKLRTLSFIFPLEAAGKTETIKEPPKTDDTREEIDIDLSSCQRQKGNQPLQNVTNRRENSCFLPVLKPIRPSKNDDGKRKMRGSKRSPKERGTKAKIESRKAREKAKSELSIKPNVEPRNVEDILKKLISFSKDYQGYFTEQPKEKKKDKENLLGTVFKNVYAASTKESPRIQYSKEFEEPTDTPLSPLVNGHSITTKDQDTIVEVPIFTMNRDIKEPTLTINRDVEKITLTMNGETEEPTLSRETDIEEPMLAMNGDTDEPIPSRNGDTDEPTTTMNGEREEPTLTMNGDTGEPILSRNGDTDEPTLTMNTDIEEPTLTINREVEKITLTMNGDTEEPTLTMNKDIEEPTRTINGDTEKPTLPMNGDIEEPIQKMTKTSLGTAPKSTNMETEYNGTITLTASDDVSTAQEETGKINDLERIPNGETSRSKSPEPMKSAVETVNGVDIPESNRNGTRSPGESVPTYASVVKQGKAFQTDVVTSQPTQPNKKPSKTRSKPSRASRKARKDQAVVTPPTAVSTQRAPVPPPPKETESVGKPSNPFTILPEDSPGEVTLKSSKRKAKNVPGLPSRRPPAWKTNEDRRVVESLATVDDAHVDNSGIAGAIAKLSIQPGGLPGTPSEVASSAQEDYVRRQNWEMGTMDYMGRDSFDNIWSKICETIGGKGAKEVDQGGASSTPSAEPMTPKKDEVAPPEETQGQPQKSPEAMIAPSDVVPPIESGASADAGKVASELTAKASEVAAKATEALEAFGKLFVSGPVAIKSEVTEEAQKPGEASEKKEEPQAGETAPTDGKQATEVDEEGKPKKGVINKILELVGVGKPETSTAVFYDTEQPQGDQPKEDRGNSVFYDTEAPPAAGAGEEPKLAAAAEPSKARAPSPSLTLKTTPEPEVVCPTPPSTPMTPLPGFKDDKMLTVDDTIKATPPVTDKKFDDVAKPAETIKSAVDNIIDAAMKIAEDQLQEPKKEPQSPDPSTSMALVPRLNDALEVFGKMFVSGPVTIKSEVPEEPPKPAIPMHDVPGRAGEPAAPVTPQATEGIPPAPAAASQPAEPEKPVSPQSTEAAPVEPTTPATPQPAELAATEAPKPAEPSTPQIAELAAAAVGAVAAVLSKVADPAPQAEAPATPQPTDTAAQPAPPQPTEAPTLVVQPPTPLTLGPINLGTPAPGVEPVAPVTPQPAESAPPTAQPETPKPTEPVAPQPTEPTTPAEQAAPAPTPPTPQPEVPPTEAPKPDEPKTDTPSILSKANEALEAFGKHFVSGPITLKSEVPEPATPEKPEGEPVTPAKDPEPSEGQSKASEALEAFGKVFVSGPVTLKSEVPETPGKTETDAVHRVLQSKPEEQPIYSNVEGVEEIKVTSEEDRRKQKPQSSKLTDQILMAIPPEMRKPFTDPVVAAEVAQLLSAVEHDTTSSILTDKSVGEEDATPPEEGDGSGASAPPVPPRRNRSKGRDAPQPPPKKKGKNGKD